MEAGNSPKHLSLSFESGDREDETRKDFGNNEDNEIGGNQRRIKLGNTLDNFTTTLKIT